MLLSGVFTALITPFKDDKTIDWSALEKIVTHQVENGITGLVPCGTTGESPTLTHSEHNEVICRVIKIAKAINPKVVIIAGAGSNSTAEALQLSEEAAKNGADYILSVNPYYNKPTQEGLYQHFKTIADNSPIPILLYNIPGRTSVTLSIDTIVKLSQHSNIIGIKEATGDLNFMTKVYLNCNKSFTLLSGDDNLLLPILSIGGCGVISVISNLFPKEITSIVQDYLAGNIVKAQETYFKYFTLCNSLFLETNPIPVKYAASKLGFCSNSLRLPLTSLSKSYQEELDKQLLPFL